MILSVLLLSVLYTLVDAAAGLSGRTALETGKSVATGFLIKSELIFIYLLFLMYLQRKKSGGKFFGLTGLIIAILYIFLTVYREPFRVQSGMPIILKMDIVPAVLKYAYFLAAGIYINRISERTGLGDFYRNTEKLPYLPAVFITLLMTDDLLFAVISSTAGLRSTLQGCRIILSLLISIAFLLTGVKHTRWLRFTLEAEQLFSHAYNGDIKLKDLFSNSDSVFWIINLKNGKVEFINKAFERIWELPLETAYSSLKPWLDSIHPEDRTYVEKNSLPGHLDSDRIIEYRIISGSGKWIREKLIPIKDSRGNTVKVLRFSEDVTDENSAQGKFADERSTLSVINRKLYFQSIEERIKRYRLLETPSPFALILLDIRGFREVNYRFGNRVGDKTLEIIYFRLKDILRNTDRIFRTGGDNFALIIGPFSRENHVIIVLEKIFNEFCNDFLIGKHLISLKVNMGVALYPRNGASAEELNQKAELARLKAKTDDKSHIYCNEEINSEALYRLNCIAEIQRTLDSGGFFLHYQPIVSGEGRILGAECLLRWNNPELQCGVGDRCSSCRT